MFELIIIGLILAVFLGVIFTIAVYIPIWMHELEESFNIDFDFEDDELNQIF